MTITLLTVLLLISLAINVIALIHFLRKAKPRSESYELREFLHDITGGEGIVRIQRVAPVDVLIRSPKG
jgi:hypothetical protein